MISAKRLSELLAALHAVPLEQENWQVFLTALCGQLEARLSLYLSAGVKQPLGIRANAGPPFDIEHIRRYNEIYHQTDPYSIAFARQPHIGPILGEELVAPAQMQRTDFYRYYSTVNLHRAMFLPAIFEPDRLELITIWRTLQQAPFDSESVELLRVIHHNAAAESMLELGDGVAIRNRQLCATDPLIHGKLQALIAAAAAAGGALLTRPGGMLRLPRPSGKRSLQVMVRPLRLSGAFLAAHVLVVIGDPDRATPHSEVILGSLYGLTRAEVEIANALLAGRTIEEIAERRGVTAGTLRIQMKSIFLKTDTRRQSDLLKLLLSLPALAGRLERK